MMMMMMITILGLSRERPSRTMAIKCVLIRFHSIRFHSSRLHSIRFDLFGPPLIGGRRGGRSRPCPYTTLGTLFFWGESSRFRKCNLLDFPWALVCYYYANSAVVFPLSPLPFVFLLVCFTWVVVCVCVCACGDKGSEEFIYCSLTMLKNHKAAFRIL